MDTKNDKFARLRDAVENLRGAYFASPPETRYRAHQVMLAALLPDTQKPTPDPEAPEAAKHFSLNDDSSWVRMNIGAESFDPLSPQAVQEAKRLSKEQPFGYPVSIVIVATPCGFLSTLVKGTTTEVRNALLDKKGFISAITEEPVYVAMELVALIRPPTLVEYAETVAYWSAPGTTETDTKWYWRVGTPVAEAAPGEASETP